MLTQNFVQMFKFWSSQFATLNHEQRGFYKEKVFVYSIYDMEIQKQPPEVFYKKDVFKNFGIFTGKHVCWSLFLMKLQD